MSTKSRATPKSLLTPQLVEALAAEGLVATVEVQSVRDEDVGERLAAAYARVAIAHQRTEALAAIGQVGVGVTHEVRNLMTGILGFAQLARHKAASVAAAVEPLQLIEQESQRCLELLAQYMSLSRPVESARVPLDLTHVLAAVEKLARHHLQLNGVKLVVEVSGDLPLVRGDAGALKQVLLNLLMNAMQAMKPAGGTVRLIGVRGADGSALVSVQDDGPGVPAALAAEIFAPFFSTKPAGEGTGMGLSVSRTLVEQDGGTLALDPNATHGASFVVRLPGLGK